jgi:3-oxoacyl-[acyl-carrier-protein] synthase-3
MIGIAHITTYVPGRFESNRDRMQAFEIDEAFLRDKIGVSRVSRKEEGEDTSDLALHATRALVDAGVVALDQVQCLVVCTQNPDGGGIPHVSAIVHGELGLLESCASFDIALGCSGYVYGLSVVSAFMHANGLRTGILVTADPYSKIVDPEDKNTALLFGDAATATLLTDTGNWIPERFAFFTRGADRAALQVEAGRLRMNGRAVFNFSATVVPTQVDALLEAAGLRRDQVDRYFFHQGSRFIVDTIAMRMKLPQDKVALGLDTQGNTVSSSIPLLLAPSINGANPAGTVFVLSGFGVGLSSASAILRNIDRTKEPPR